ncbi:MAG: hypothetical protein KKE86_12150 [Planctomycetes bacterium]|nr:hypothetical protein [Planctomycetota bacterium]MBU4400074.1 hypothetical protein [Planctomycetota bacterium]MCG2683864.1 hypothetical protein [Planctomycetales bacterium]
MSKHQSTGRKTRKIVRMPATKCAHLRKKMQQRRLEGNKTPRGRGG